MDYNKRLNKIVKNLKNKSLKAKDEKEVVKYLNLMLYTKRFQLMLNEVLEGDNENDK